MISCVDLERICSALSLAFGTISLSFGGKSVILAGDFAQLQPAGKGHSLYSANVGTWSSSGTNHAQKAALGKSIWHTFTTVVILRENMRQRGMRSEDVAFRTALANMRYAQCTEEDISLLSSRVYSPGRSSGVQSMRGFEEVSIITTRNAHRDAVNEDNAERFAARHGRALHFFHSKDTWGKVKDSVSIRKAQHEYRTITDPVRTSNRIPGSLQEALWRLSPSMSEHHAGVLALCEDMPVLLKTNEATELCATNGAPGRVAGWESHSDVEGREYLDVLFIRLIDPPQTVQLDGLPENVIPITRLKRSVRCTLPIGDITISVQREQV
ncbi:hypothetical protein OH77DRAFT_1577497, partial [Trametes cingulata]